MPYTPRVVVSSSRQGQFQRSRRRTGFSHNSLVSMPRCAGRARGAMGAVSKSTPNTPRLLILPPSPAIFCRGAEPLHCRCIQCKETGIGNYGALCQACVPGAMRTVQLDPRSLNIAACNRFVKIKESSAHIGASPTHADATRGIGRPSNFPRSLWVWSFCSMP